MFLPGTKTDKQKTAMSGRMFSSISEQRHAKVLYKPLAFKKLPTTYFIIKKKKCIRISLKSIYQV